MRPDIRAGCGCSKDIHATEQSLIRVVCSDEDSPAAAAWTAGFAIISDDLAGAERGRLHPALDPKIIGHSGDNRAERVRRAGKIYGKRTRRSGGDVTRVRGGALDIEIIDAGRV